MAERDIVVVSDLHLGRGKNPATGRYSRLEAFFFDDDFDGFCRWLCSEAEAHKIGVTLVLNGDTLRHRMLHTSLPLPEAAPPRPRWSSFRVLVRHRDEHAHRRRQT